MAAPAALPRPARSRPARSDSVRCRFVRSYSVRPRLVRAFAAATFAAAVAAAAVLLGPAGPASAASLTRVTSFGSNPGNLGMFSYRPDGLPGGAPLVVALHGCAQTAADYHANAGWSKYADLWRFAVVYPQQQSANNSSSCFNWFQPSDQGRGQGEALSIKQMVDFAIANYGADRRRVFVTGLSAGGAMTAVMLAAYPEVFSGGAVIAGIAYRCGTDLTSGLLCMSQRQARTPRQWGDLVRDANPGYAGPWPRVSIWYGADDAVVAPVNADQLRDQWTNVWGIGQTPSDSTSLPGNTSRSDYRAGGASAVQVFRVGGIGHGTPVDPGAAGDQCGAAGSYFLDSICSSYHIAREWALDGGAAPSPTGSPTAAPPTSAPPVPPVCVTASNYHHVQAGRAHHSLGYVYANGSGQAMGLYNVFTRHTLRQTGPDYWVLADAAC